MRKRLSSICNRGMERLRVGLARPDALLQLSGLGIVTGLVSGALIVVFRWLIDIGQVFLLPDGAIENFEALDTLMRLALPIGGALLIAALFHLAARGNFSSGVVQVMERMAYHEGHISIRSLILQFFGAAIALVSGQSMGREGPSVHIGAASGSLVGQKLSLPNNAIRTLAGCGVAAAVGASFNTPLAGVIFSLEVIMLEYTLASFTPVILAAVSATLLSRLVYGAEPAFALPALQLGSFAELPVILALGIIVGCAGAALIQAAESMAVRARTWPFWLRMLIAGTGTGVCALLYPEVMGVGYDTVNLALVGQMGLGLLLGVTLAKLLATAMAIGLGMPAGLIGPTLFLGATLGGFIGLLAAILFPSLSIHSGLYALLGMGAMMGATLQAPLAALTAVLELTGNPAFILPGMLAIVSAGLTSSELFGKASIFVMMLRARGLDYRHDPFTQALRRTGVASIMVRSYVRHDRHIEVDAARTLLADNPDWILIDSEDEPVALMPAIDLARTLESDADIESLDLLEIPAKRQQVASTHLQASLQEALDSLDENNAEALVVERMTAPMIKQVYGVLTREHIEAAYRTC